MINLIGRSKLYSKKKCEGSLPNEVEKFNSKIDWPIDLNEKFNISQYYKESEINKSIHYGIDIQLKENSSIIVPEDSQVIYFQDDIYPERGNLADIYLYGLDTKILYLLGHLDSNSISKKVGKKKYISFHSNNFVEKGSILAKIGKWEIKSGQINNETRKVFGDYFNHLHFETHYYLEIDSTLKKGKTTSRWNSFNPLLILKNLK